MSKTPRLHSSTGIYHVMVRGNNKQSLFKTNEDYDKFLTLLFEHHNQKHIYVYAWCLMSNHAHLLIKEKAIPISETFQSLLSLFVWWHNAKYKMVGHLFQGRFRSRLVEDPIYFQRVFRYIHRNPLDAGLCLRMEDYPYSSYFHYFRSGKYKNDDLILNIMRKDEFEQYHQEKDEDSDFLSFREKPRITDEEFIKIVKESGLAEDVNEVNDLPREERTEMIQILLEEGASYRQINHLTGIHLSTIRAISKQMHQ